MGVKYYRAISYKDNDMYKKSLSTEKIFKNTQEVFNPVPKLLLTMGNLTMKGMNYQDATEGQLRILDLLKNSNNLDDKLEQLIEYEILFDQYWVELVNDGEKEIINLIDETMMRKVVKVGDEVRYCQFTGRDSEGEVVQKEYFWNYEDNPNQIVEKRGSIENVIPMEKMRLFERNSKYRIETLLNKIDKINEFKCFIYNMSSTNGDPLLFMKLIQKLTPEERKILQLEKFNEATRTIASDDADAVIAYVELSGQMLPHMQKEVDTFKTEIIDDYPETNMAFILNSSNISEDSLIIKMSDLDAKIKMIRNFLNKTINFFFDILGGLDVVMGFDTIIQESTKDKITEIRELKAEGLLDRETAIEMLAEIGFIDDAQKVIGRVKKEEEDNLGMMEPYPQGTFPNNAE